MIDKVQFIFTSAAICLLVILMATTLTLAQDEPPGGDDGGDPDIPIDGGISLLLAAGAAYGIKKVHQYKQNQ